VRASYCCKWLREAEVNDEDLARPRAATHCEVLGFDVSVHQIAPMQLLDARQYLRDQPHYRLQQKAGVPALPSEVRRRLPEERDRHPVTGPLATGPEQTGDPDAVQQRSVHQRLARKLRRLHIRGLQFERNSPVMFRIFRFVDFPKAPEPSFFFSTKRPLPNVCTVD
jgi:hypothetical protein